MVKKDFENMITDILDFFSGGPSLVFESGDPSINVVRKWYDCRR
jgi:hypothetical protein